MPLSNFGKSTTKNGPTSLAAPPAELPPAPPKDTRKQQTIRLSAAQWRRVKDFALDENATFKDLAVRGISRLMEDRGLPPLEG